MRLVEDKVEDVRGKKETMNGVNGYGKKYSREVEEDPESDIEDVEPVSATLVLRVVSEPSTQNSSTNNAYLHVQLQRSNSIHPLQNQDQQFYPEDYGRQDRGQVRSLSYPSRESSMSPQLTSMESVHNDTNGINTVDFMEKVSEQAVSIKQGLEMVKVELDDPGRLLHSENDIKELSILKKLAGESMKNLKNLYDETKYLRAYLEKLEAKVHYDMTVKLKTPYQPPWYRRVIFLTLLIGGGAAILFKLDKSSFEKSLNQLSISAGLFCKSLFGIILGNNLTQSGVVTLQ